MNENWRNATIDLVLHVSSRSGDSEDALLRAIRRHRPGCFTLMTYLNRTQLLKFVQEQASDFQSLLTGKDGYYSRHEENDEDIVQPYVGWYSVTWEGVTIEIAFTPSTPDNGYIVCAADQEEPLKHFVATMSEYALRPAHRCLSYGEGEWTSAPDLDAQMGKVDWDDVVLAPELMSSVRDAVEGFFANRGAFTALGFSWRRGILLIGPPGTGKTMVCKAAATALPDLPFLYVRNVRDGRETEAIKTIFDRARRLAPCILAFEDMDGLVDESNRTFFLNEMDGFKSNEGLLVIASSNHPGRIDEALLKRPSRFDRVFHIGLPELNERTEFCRRILSRPEMATHLDTSLDIEHLSLDVAERTSGFTPAYLKEVFISAALQCAQNGAMILDERFANAVMSQIEELKAHLKRMNDPEALAEMHSNGATMGLRR